MQFLKTVFWAIVAAVAALFCWVNWTPVTVNLWNDIQAEIKLPILLLVAFLLGFLPTWSILRARIWSHRRRMDAMERNRVTSMPVEAAPADDAEPVI